MAAGAGAVGNLPGLTFPSLRDVMKMYYTDGSTSQFDGLAEILVNLNQGLRFLKNTDGTINLDSPIGQVDVSQNAGGLGVSNVDTNISLKVPDTPKNPDGKYFISQAVASGMNPSGTVDIDVSTKGIRLDNQAEQTSAPNNNVSEPTSNAATPQAQGVAGVKFTPGRTTWRKLIEENYTLGGQDIDFDNLNEEQQRMVRGISHYISQENGREGFRHNEFDAQSPDALDENIRTRSRGRNGAAVARDISIPTSGAAQNGRYDLAKTASAYINAPSVTLPEQNVSQTSLFDDLRSVFSARAANADEAPKAQQTQENTTTAEATTAETETTQNVNSTEEASVQQQQQETTGPDAVDTATVAAVAELGRVTEYTVQSGDNLWNIAKGQLKLQGAENPSDEQVQVAHFEIMQENPALFGEESEYLIPDSGRPLPSILSNQAQITETINGDNFSAEKAWIIHPGDTLRVPSLSQKDTLTADQAAMNKKITDYKVTNLFNDVGQKTVQYKIDPEKGQLYKIENGKETDITKSVDKTGIQNVTLDPEAHHNMAQLLGVTPGAHNHGAVKQLEGDVPGGNMLTNNDSNYYVWTQMVDGKHKHHIIPEDYKQDIRKNGIENTVFGSEENLARFEQAKVNTPPSLLSKRTSLSEIHDEINNVKDMRSLVQQTIESGGHNFKGDWDYNSPIMHAEIKLKGGQNITLTGGTETHVLTKNDLKVMGESVQIQQHNGSGNYLLKFPTGDVAQISKDSLNISQKKWDKVEQAHKFATNDPAANDAIYDLNGTTGGPSHGPRR